jgi:hypothetical protein
MSGLGGQSALDGTRGAKAAETTTLIDGRCTPDSCRLAAPREVGNLGLIADISDNPIEAISAEVGHIPNGS